ncbi:Folate-biopterin transporter 1, chloroplastic [Coccomyxa sp. Obi]|nr:Folate-biopterin transporter 1, chloroplastic [Coccomyxa sp. Obi]
MVSPKSRPEERQLLRNVSDENEKGQHSPMFGSLAHRGRAEVFQLERPVAAVDGAEGESESPEKTWRQRVRNWRFRPMGLEPTPELAAVAVAYFVQGVKMSLGTLTEQFYLKDDLQFDPAQAETWKAIAHLPWMIKPLYGFLTDTFPIYGLRRQPYIVICGLTGTAAFGLLGALPAAALPALVLMTAGELAIAFSDVVIDGVVVERSRGEDQETAGSLQSICWGSQAVGVLSSAYTSGWLIGRVGARPVLALMACFPLLMCGTAFLIKEERSRSPTSPRSAIEPEVQRYPRSPASAGEAELRTAAGGPSGVDEEKEGLLGDDYNDRGNPEAHHQAHLEGAGTAPLSNTERLRQQLWALWQAIIMPQILLPAAFIFLWQSTPSAAGAMFFFYTNYLGFSPEFVGRIKLLDGIAQLLGVYLFNVFLKGVQLRRLFFGLALAGVVAGFTQLLLVTGANRSLGLDDKLFVLADSVLVTGLGRIALMPCLVLAARVCPEGVEATLYAALMSVSNAASGAGDVFGAALTKLLGITAHEFSNMSWLVLVCTLCGFLPLPFLRLIPDNEKHAPLPTEEPV